MSGKRAHDNSESSGSASSDDEPTAKRPRYVPVHEEGPWVESEAAVRLLLTEHKNVYNRTTDEGLHSHLNSLVQAVYELAAKLERVKQDTRRYKYFMDNCDASQDFVEATCGVCDGVWFESDRVEEGAKLYGPVPKKCKKCKRTHCTTCPCVIRAAKPAQP